MKTQEWIKTLLKSKGRKLKDAAEVLRIPAPRITDIIKGSREVQSDEIIPLAGLLGLSVTALLKSLEKGKLIELEEEQQARLPVLGQIMGNGEVQPVPDSLGFHSVPLPPDAEGSDGLYCYLMGDDCLAQEIRKGSIIIAADPKMHFCPIVPGAVFLVRRAPDKLAPRVYHQTPDGDDWLIPLPARPNPAFEAWPFSLFPTSDRRNPDRTIVQTEDIALGILWVHRRYSPEH